MATMEQRMVGPTEAAELLQLNVGNRPISKVHIEKLARAMKADQWGDTGVPIIIYKNGTESKLEDGQHRLHAIIRSGVTIPMWISVVNKSVFDKVDVAIKTRNLRTIVMLRGDNNIAATSTVASALSVSQVMVTQGIRTWALMSAAERATLLDRHSHLVPWGTQRFIDFRRETGRYIPTGVLGAAMEIYQLNGAPATAFFESLATGDMIRRGEPVFALRSLLIAPRMTRGRSGSNNHLSWYEITVRAWNAHAKGLSVSFFRTSGDIPKIAKIDGDKATEEVAAD